MFNDLFDVNINLAIEIGDEAVVVERILDQLWEGLYGSSPLQDRNKYGRAIGFMRRVFTASWQPST